MFCGVNAIFFPQDIGKPAVSCSFKGAEASVHLRIGTQGADTANRGHNTISPNYYCSGARLRSSVFFLFVFNQISDVV